MPEVEFSVLKGLTLRGINGWSAGSSETRFITTDGREFRLYHYQDCCEHVCLCEIIGDPADLLGYPLLEAEEVVGQHCGEPKQKPTDESWTWTFYKLGTIRGHVTLRWLGESNGYYSESVSFEEVTG